MKQIKYRYCIDENDNLVCIDDITDATRHEHKWRCLGCGQEMVAKLGQKRIKHFSHKVDMVCDGESYLHKLAKRRIREKFQTAESFPITFVRDTLCNQRQKCFFFSHERCHEKRSIVDDLRRWYNTCQEEVMVREFRPDLLLTCSMIPDRKPIFIEIYKTHQSEATKLSSDHKIIETTQIKSEEDIEDIIKRGFIEEQNCQTFKFNPRPPDYRKKDVFITRFALFKDGRARVYKPAHEGGDGICCNKLDKKVVPNSVCELNMKEFGIELWGNSETLDSYESGLIYLVKKKNWQIKNCILCKFRVYNEYYGRHICTHYKFLGQDYKFPQQTMANRCKDYQIDPQKMNYPLSELEKTILEVPT